MARLRPDLKYFNPFALAEVPEVLKRNEVDVRRIVPLERQLLGHRKTTAKTKRHANPVRRKVRERDNRLVRHAQRLVEESARILDRKSVV